MQFSNRAPTHCWQRRHLIFAPSSLISHFAPDVQCSVRQYVYVQKEAVTFAACYVKRYIYSRVPGPRPYHIRLNNDIQLYAELAGIYKQNNGVL